MSPLAGDPSRLPLFSYGSLRDPDLRAFLLGDRPNLTSLPATLLGYRRYEMLDYNYPFVVPAPEGTVEGDVLFGLTADDYAVLDAYEDVDQGIYERVQVTVQTSRGPLEAWTYVKGPTEP